MSRAKTIVGLAAALLIASAFFVTAKDTLKTIEVADSPASSKNLELQVATQQSRTSLSATSGAMSGTVAASLVAPPLAENAYDFNNIDGIPGFGRLPPDYDSAPVMPHIGSR